MLAVPEVHNSECLPNLPEADLPSVKPLSLELSALDLQLGDYSACQQRLKLTTLIISQLI